CEIYNTNTFVNNEKLDVSFINSKISTELINFINCSSFDAKSSKFSFTEPSKLSDSVTKGITSAMPPFFQGIDTKNIIIFNEGYVVDSLFNNEVEIKFIENQNLASLFKGTTFDNHTIENSAFNNFSELFSYCLYSVVKCEFFNCNNIFTTDESTVVNSLFIGCKKVMEGGLHDISESEFRNCEDVLEITVSKVKNSIFKDC